MTGQQQPILSIILWTIAMILCLSGVLIGFIFLAAESPGGLVRSLAIAGIMLAIVGFAYSLKQIILSEQGWKKRVIQHVLSHEGQLLARWQYPFRQWQAFQTADLAGKRKHPIVATAVVVGMLGVALGIAFAYEGANTGLLAVALAVLPLVGVMVWWITNAQVSLLKKAYASNKDGEIAVGRTGAVINRRYLIPFKFFGGSLAKVSVESKYGMDVLCFTILVRAGNSTALHHHYVPVPEGARLEAGLVKQRLDELYKLKS
jgi:hypothetical protein